MKIRCCEYNQLLGLFIVVLFFLPASVLACEGSWKITTDSNAVEYKKDYAAYIPVYIHLSREARKCGAPYVYLTLKSAKHGVLNSPTGQLAAEILDNNYRTLIYHPNKGYKLRLSHSRQTKFWVKVKQARLSRAETYTSIIDGHLYVTNIEKPSSTTDKRMSKSESIKLEVPPFVHFQMITGTSSVMRGSGDSFRMMLGELTTGKKRAVSFSLLSNANVQVSVRQVVGGLKHTKRLGWIIPYDLYFDGKKVNKHLKYRLQSSTDGLLKEIPMRVEIGNTDFARAGEYRDTVVIELKAKY